MREDRIYRPQADDPRISEPSVVHKLKNVLRKRKGDEVVVFDGKGRQFSGIIDKMTASSIELAGLKPIRSAERRLKRLTLAFPLLKGSRVDLLLQKATELGIDCFIPLICRHTAVGVPGKAKSSHWEKILIEATAQSGRLFLPDLKEPERFDDLVGRFNQYDLILVAEPSAGQKIDQALTKPVVERGNSLLLLVGPEGGFAASERKMLKAQKNAVLVRISENILRAETAAIFLAGLTAHYIDADKT